MRPTGEPLTVSVNVSARQLRPKGGQSSLIETVRRTLADTGLPASALALEITESTLMDGDELPVLYELKRLGVQTMLDDFGTGHSSLSRLSDVPLDVVKIDRRFVSGLGEHQNREPIVAAIIAMADALGLRAIAEGVETVRELRFPRGPRVHSRSGLRAGPADARGRAHVDGLWRAREVRGLTRAAPGAPRI